VQALERLMAVYSPRLFAALGLYLPLITTNCAVLGVALLDAKQSESLFDSLLFSAGSGLGFTLVLVLFSAVRERLESAAIPAPFRGSAIGLITAGLAALAFSGFQGLGPL
jgi:electron transport complex protein RnfA